MKLKIGKLAPEFSLPDQEGTIHNLSDYRGNWVLVYFYPNDFTPGCTAEACNLRDAFPAFNKTGARVLGISINSPESHRRFAEKYNLPFILLSDSKKKVVKLYGVWVSKKFMGREFLGIERTSFLISPEGKIAKIYETVKPTIHAQEVLGDLESR